MGLIKIRCTQNARVHGRLMHNHRIFGPSSNLEPISCRTARWQGAVSMFMPAMATFQCLLQALCHHFSVTSFASRNLAQWWLLAQWLVVRLLNLTDLLKTALEFKNMDSLSSAFLQLTLFNYFFSTSSVLSLSLHARLTAPGSFHYHPVV